MSGSMSVGYNHELLMLKNKITMNVSVKETVDVHKSTRIFQAAVHKFQAISSMN